MHTINVQNTPLYPFPSKENSLPFPLINTLLRHPRLVHHPHARRVLIIYNRPHVNLGVRYPKRMRPATALEQRIQRLSRETLTPRSRQEHIREINT